MAAQGDREDKKLVIQRSQLRQHGEFWHVSVSERQKLRVPFLRTVLPPEVGESARAMASTARQKRSYLHHQGEFQLQNCTVGTVHDSDHEGVVRIFVGHSYHSNELFTLYYIRLYYITRHFISYTRSVIRFFVRCMECDRPSLNPLEFLWKNFLPLVYICLYISIVRRAVNHFLLVFCVFLRHALFPN